MASSEFKDPVWTPHLDFPQSNSKWKGPSAGDGKSLEVRLEKNLEKVLTAPPRDPKKEMRLARKTKAETAGSKWFDLPATTLTPELKQELHLLKLRNVLDPKHHYKSADSSKLPKFFQVGTVVEGAADFYSGRLTKKERKTSFTGELLADETLRRYRKKKSLAIREQGKSGGKKFYQQRKNKQKPSWAKT